MNRTRLDPSPAEACARLQTRLFTRSFLRGAAAGTLVAGITVFFGLPRELALGLWLLLLGAAWVTSWLRHRLRQDGKLLLAKHLNRVFPNLEESTGLIISPPATPSALQRLQTERVRRTWPEALANTSAWLPPLRAAWPLFAILTGMLALCFGAPLSASPTGRITGTAKSPVNTLPDALPEIISIEITPPAYTQEPVSSASTWDLELLEGSQVTWSLTWPGPNTLVLQLDDGALRPFKGEGARTLSLPVVRTGLYRLLERTPEGDRALNGVHTLTVQRDKPPRLRILEPKETPLELPRNGVTPINYRVRINDDHGLGAVEIRASVARGSGEGVKFRDEQFTFDAVAKEGDDLIHQKTWDLRELGMEPGDEIYFFTIARDLREPEANEGRSDTVVVRWLDDTPRAPAAEGLAIDVMPEYFKSQRQIIVETEQLIADGPELDQKTLDQTSRGLGQAQGDLKQRYGQFLGDEFGEGDGASFEPDPALADHAGEPDSEASGNSMNAAGHDHEEEAPARIDTSGSAAALVERFAHDHGSAEIGPITARNPVGLMKRSISNMWQAELHLLLSEPEKALPYEYEALKYLNLARQADRIYTRRLGFEPPPVSEERRLSGDFDEVRSRNRRLAPSLAPTEAAVLAGLYALLSADRADKPFDEQEQTLLRSARALFVERSQERPALIRQAATLEKILSESRLPPSGCGDCLEQLARATWTMLPPAKATPETVGRPPGLSPESTDQFLDAVRATLDGASP